MPRAWNHGTLASIKQLYPDGGPKCDVEYRALVDVAELAAGHCSFQPGHGTRLPGEVYDERGLLAFVKEIEAQHDHSYYMFLTGIGLDAIRKLDSRWSPPD